MDITIKAAEDPRDIKVELQGLDDRYMSTNDRKIFKVDDKRLMKKAVNKLKKAEETGATMPIGAIRTCHTPFGGLFAGLNWSDITRMLKPVHWEVIRTHTETSVVATRMFMNNTDRKATINVKLFFDGYHTVTTTKEFRFDSPINYKISLPIFDTPASEQSTTTVSYRTFGEDNLSTIPYRGHFCATLELEPGAERAVNLHVTRCTNELKVTYKATLVGDLACRFISFFRWYRRSYPMSNVLEAAGLLPAIMAREDIKISYYTCGEVMPSEQ